MKSKLILFFFLQAGLISCAQDSAKESFERAVQFKKNEKFKEALKEYDNVITINPNNEAAFINRGNIKSILEDDLGAIEDFNEAEKLDAADPEVYYNRGNSEHNLKRYKEATLDYNKAIKYKEHEDYFLGRGNSKKAIGEYKEAIEDYSKAISINANFINAYYNRANSKQKN